MAKPDIHILAMKGASVTPGHVHGSRSIAAKGHHEILVGADDDSVFKNRRRRKNRVLPKKPIPINPRLKLLKAASPHVNYKASSNTMDDINAHVKTHQVHLHAEDDDSDKSTYKSWEAAKAKGRLHASVQLHKIPRVGGISGTKIRHMVSKDDKKSFDKVYDTHMPKDVHPNWKNDVWRHLKHHMGLKESLDINSESEKDSDMVDLNEQFEQAINSPTQLPPTNISQVDLQNIVAETSLEDFDLTKDDAYLLHLIAPDKLDDDGDSVDKDALVLHESRVLTIPQRLKRSISLRRLSKRYAQLRKIKATRMATPERLQMRARKAALTALRSRALGKSGKKYSALTPQQKIQIDQALERRYGSGLSAVVARLARTLSMLIRRKEMGRLSRARGGTNAHVNAQHQDLSEKKKPEIKDEDDEESAQGLYGDDELHIKDSDMKSTKKHKLRRRDHFSEARKSKHDANSELDGMGSGDHIIDSLVKASKNEHYKVKWTHAEPSSIHPAHARMGIKILGQLGGRPGMTGLEKQKITVRMGHSPHWFYKSIGLDEAKIKPIGSSKDPVSINSINKIRLNKDDAAAQARQQNYAAAMNPSTAAGQPGNFSIREEFADDFPPDNPLSWNSFTEKLKS